MDHQSLRVLEFPQIQRFLHSLAVTEPGRQAAAEVNPSTDRAQIQVWLGQVTELKKYLQSGNSLPLGGIEPLDPIIRRVTETGQVLGPDEFLLVTSTLAATRSLSELVSQCQPQYGRMSDLLANLQPLPELESKIEHAIDRRGRIRDRASPELKRLRKEIEQLRKRVHTELTEILEREASRKTLQDKLISVRNDRLVIPLRSDARGALEGIVHDISHSGATCFVEPLSVVPLNNHLSQARGREREEQVRILRELSEAVLAETEALLHNQHWLGFIDCVHAKVRLSFLLHAREPQLNQDNKIRLLQAAHPVLVLQQRAQEGSGLPVALKEMVLGDDLQEIRGSKEMKAVPIDLDLDEHRKTLIISGANTGGKTVSLKTLGLLGAMVQAGLHIPVAEGSEWPVLEGIFAEIGDEQDVRAHLSTFSARIQRLANLLRLIGSRSLVLLDEIGTGTDPAEGAALALAVLEELRCRGPFIAVTTHYHLVKAYGMLQPGVMNVSVAFDEDSGRPIYRLLYGHPGTSNALQIAADLGMPAEIIEVAKRHLDKDEGRTIELIRKLEEACLKAETDGEELKCQRQQLEEVQTGLVRDHQQLVQSRQGILEEARQQSGAFLAEAEREIKSAISHLQQGGMRAAMATQKKVQQIREGLNSVLESPRREKDGVLTTPVAEGKSVRLRGVSGSGILLRIKDQGRRAEVQMGEKRVEVDTEALESLPASRDRLGGEVPGNGIRVFREPPETRHQRLHLVGLRVEEALPLLDKAIDQAILEGSSEIQVVHGHGTGRLRQAVQDFLAEHAVVKGFHLEHQSRGGRGVTVVELKD